MMIKILLHGWLQRSFFGIFTLAAIGVRITMQEESQLDLLYALVVFVSFFIILTMTTRLPQFTHSNMAKLLPNYQQRLKQAIITIWVISLLPSLLVLPDIVMLLGLISVMTLLAIIFVAMIYQPIFQACFWLLFFSPLAFDYLAPYISGRTVMLFCAWALPLVLFLLNFSLNKLVTYRGNSAHVHKIIAMMNVSMEKTMAVQEMVPLHQRSRLSQWWTNTHFNYYRQQLNKGIEASLSNNQLIAICCQGVNSFGINAYSLWASAVGVLCLVGLYIDESYYHYFNVFMTVIPIMILGVGTIAVFQIIQNKKGYLAYLATMPRFANKNSFSYSFISYVVLNQLALYTFIAIIVGAMMSVYNHINLTTYINLVLVLYLYGLFHLSIMFLMWKTKEDHSNKVVWLMVISLISLLLFSIVLTKSIDIELTKNLPFMFAYIFIIALFSFSLSRHCKYKTV